MADEPEGEVDWGLPIEELRSPDGEVRIRFARDLRDGVPIAELLPGHPTDEAAAALLLARLPGWQAAGDPLLGRRLLERGAVTERHAYTMAIATSLAGEGWSDEEPGAGLRVVPIDTSTLDPVSLLESQLAAYPPGHPDHDADIGSLLGMLVLMMAGDILGELQPESALVVDEDGTVVAGIIINQREGQSPAGGTWVSDVWRHPDRPGLGAVLLKRTIAALRSRGVPHLTLAVTEGNPARQRYELLGFSVASESLRVRLPEGRVAADAATAEDFYWETWHLQADSAAVIGSGFDALLTPTFRGSFAHNGAVSRHPRNAAALVAAADRALDGLQHRYVEAIGAVSPETVAAMEARGYRHQHVVLMTRDVTAVAESEMDPRIETVDEDALREWQEAATRLWQPHVSAEVVADLVDRRVLLDRGSRVTRLAARVDGAVVGSVDLVARGPVAEIDALVVHPEHRGAGLGEALLSAAVSQARAIAVSVLVLSALTDDWPREWYRRRGFTEVSEIHEFTRDS